MDDFAKKAAQLIDVPFTKMTGSGNDFVFFDARFAPSGIVTQPEIIRSICNRHNGIGADGLVLLEVAHPTADVRVRYFNSDGTSADLCGNATLCSATLCADIGLASALGMTLETPSGIISSRVTGVPEIDLPTVSGVVSDANIPRVARERRIGFAVVGIPHLVVLCDSTELADVQQRGPVLRNHPSSGANGANVNWVASDASGVWRYRTFERGVEGETLACGTGAVATAAMLVTWGQTDSPVVLRTSSGRELTVQFKDSAVNSLLVPTLRGEGRIVFRGRIATLLGQ